MSDLMLSVLEGRQKRLKDMGDGTVAEVVVAEFDAGSIGSPSDPAWDGEAENASLISIMKACHAQLVIIAENTGA